MYVSVGSKLIFIISLNELLFRLHFLHYLYLYNVFFLEK